MINILILCGNTELLKNIANSIIFMNQNLRLCGISNNIEESKKLILQTKPDFVITTNKEIIPILLKTFPTNTPKALFISKSKKQSSNNVIYIDGNVGIPGIYSKISDIFKENIKDSKKELVTNLLIDFGFDFKISGTSFLLDAILYKDTYIGDFCLEKLVDLYAHIARIHGTSLNKVTWAINRSVEYMYEKHTPKSYENIEKYFRLKYPEKVTPKLVINLVANNLKNY